MSASSTIAVNEMAQRLAEQAGVSWSSLSNHPGYQKYIWREKARTILAAAGLELMPDGPPVERSTIQTFLT